MSSKWFTPGTDATTAVSEIAEDFDAMLRSVGIHVTAEGKARARARRLEAQARHTPEMRALWARQLGRPVEGS